MKLQSCDNCGVLLDADKLSFASDIWAYDEVTGSEYVDERKAMYNQNTGEYDKYISCPVCQEIVFEEV